MARAERLVLHLFLLKKAASFPLFFVCEKIPSEEEREVGEGRKKCK